MRPLARAAIALMGFLMLPGLLAAQVPIDPDNPVGLVEDNELFGGSSGEFLLLGASARGMALGGAFGTIVDDVSALYYNPAGLPMLDGPEANLTIMPYFADTDYYWTGLAFPFSEGDFGLGVFLARFGFSESPVFTAADPENESELTFGVDEVVAGVSFGHAFIDRFSAGFTFKFISDDLATGSLGGAKATTVAFDLGTNYHALVAGRMLRLSFVVQNLGGDLEHTGDALRFDATFADDPDRRVDPAPSEVRATGFPLPRTLRVGASYDVVSMETTRLSLMGEFLEANQQPSTFGVAAEFEWMSAETPIEVALRSSFQLQPDERNLGAQFLGDVDTDLDGLAFGGGLAYRIEDQYRLAFDYAYRHFGALGNIDVFSVSFGF